MQVKLFLSLHEGVWEEQRLAPLIFNLCDSESVCSALSLLAALPPGKNRNTH